MTTYERKRNVDREWFNARLTERGYSQRSLAKAMGVDSGTISMTIRGLRGLNMVNATSMANLLGTSTNEIYRRAGLPLEDELKGAMAEFVKLAASGIASENREGMEKALHKILNRAIELK